MSKSEFYLDQKVWQHYHLVNSALYNLHVYSSELLEVCAVFLSFPDWVCEKNRNLKVKKDYLMVRL